MPGARTPTSDALPRPGHGVQAFSAGSVNADTADRSVQQAVPKWNTIPLLVSFLCCGLTAGIIPGQMLFMQFFADAEVFSELCVDRQALAPKRTCDEQMLQMTQIINTLYVLMLGVQLACGGIFDQMGGRFCGAAGSILVALSYIGIAVTVHFVQILPNRNIMLSNMVMQFVAIADIGAWLNNFAMMGLLWQYPTQQKLVFAMMNAAYQVGSLHTCLAAWIMKTFHVSLPRLMIGWAVVQTATTVVLWKVTPGRDEYFAQAEKFLGMPLPRFDRSLTDTAKAAWDILRMDGWHHTKLCWTSSLGQAYVCFYMSVVISFGRHLFGSDHAGRTLGELCALVNGVVSLAIAPMLGILGDRFGFASFVNLQFVFLVTFSCTYWVSSWPATVLAASSVAAYTSINYMVAGSWFVHFSPPNRMGMVSGLWSFFSAVLWSLLSWLLTSWSQSLPDSIARFTRPLHFAAVLALTSSLLFCVSFARSSPFPLRPRRSAQDIIMGLTQKDVGRTVTVYGGVAV